MSVKDKVMSIDEAVARGFLEDKKVYIKAVTRNNNNKYDDDEKHPCYWKYDSTSSIFELPRIEGIMDLVFPLGKEQMEYFESKLGKNLDPNDPDSYWYKPEGRVRITKEPRLFNQGIEFDLKNPFDWIKFKVLEVDGKNYRTRQICPKDEQPIPRKDFYRIFDSGIDKKNSADMVDRYRVVYTFLGKIQNDDKKLREFLSVINFERGDNKGVPDEWDGGTMLREANNRILDGNIRDLAYNIIRDESGYELKTILYNAVRSGAIDKIGRTQYRIAWITGRTFEYHLMIEELKQMRDAQDEDWNKILKTISNFGKPRTKKEADKKDE